MSSKIDPRKKAQLMAAATSLLEWLGEQEMQKACETCVHSVKGICVLAGQAPPVEVQREGCELWQFDGVPF